MHHPLRWLLAALATPFVALASGTRSGAALPVPAASSLLPANAMKGASINAETLAGGDNLIRLGSAGDGSTSDKARINDILQHLPSAKVNLPNNFHWPADDSGTHAYLPAKNADTHFFFNEEGRTYIGGGNGYSACTALGDADLTECWDGGTLNLLRSIITGDPGSPPVHIGLENKSSGYQQNGMPFYQDVSALKITARNDKGANGSIVGEEVDLNTFDAHPFKDENVGYGVNVYKDGQGSTWQISGQTQDDTGLPPSSFATVGAELDILANGPDDPGSLYDPGLSKRWFIYLAPKENPTGHWVRNTPYKAGMLVSETGSDGIETVYIASKDGVSGHLEPRWPNAGVVTDGTTLWTYGEPRAMSVGVGVWLDSGESPVTSYSAGLATNGRFGDAVIDLSRATLTHASGKDKGAAIRLAADEPIDFSGDATIGGQNRHTLQYSSGRLNALVYRTPSGVAFSIDDHQTVTVKGNLEVTGGVDARGTLHSHALITTGAIKSSDTISGSAFIGSVRAGITAAGTRQSDATLLQAEDNVINTCVPGAGVKLPQPSIGEHIRVLNRGSAICRVYPPAGGRIEAGEVDAPSSVPPTSDVTFEAFSATQWYQ